MIPLPGNSEYVGENKVRVRAKNGEAVAPEEFKTDDENDTVDDPRG